MKNLNSFLRNGDPAAADEGLTPSQVDVMRRAVVTAVRQPGVLRTPWHRPLGVAAMVALTIAAGVIAGQKLSERDVPALQRPAAPPEAERRQLQFSTAGGTRIIWVFDPDFSVKETVP